MKPAMIVGILYVLFGITAVGHRDVSRMMGHERAMFDRGDGPLPTAVYVGGAAIAVGVGLVVGGSGRTN